jgi:hypothetical protein
MPPYLMRIHILLFTGILSGPQYSYEGISEMVPIIASGYYMTSLRVIIDTVPFGPEQTGVPTTHLLRNSSGVANTLPITAMGVCAYTECPIAKPWVSEIIQHPGSNLLEVIFKVPSPTSATTRPGRIK